MLFHTPCLKLENWKAVGDPSSASLVPDLVNPVCILKWVLGGGWVRVLGLTVVTSCSDPWTFFPDESGMLMDSKDWVTELSLFSRCGPVVGFHSLSLLKESLECFASSLELSSLRGHLMHWPAGLVPQGYDQFGQEVDRHKAQCCTTGLVRCHPGGALKKIVSRLVLLKWRLCWWWPEQSDHFWTLESLTNRFYWWILDPAI